MRVVITGGGTGGHVYPGLAVAEALRDRDPAVEILFVGGRGLEQEIVPREGIAFRVVASEPWPRRLSVRSARAAAVLAAGAGQAAWLLSKFRPHAVLATGGYAAAPVGVVAGVTGRPLVVQEQNLIPGATNRLLARWAAFVSVAHPDAATLFPGRAVITGVPVRKAALGGDRRRGLQRFGLEDGRFTVLVIGGSLGAATLNAAAVETARLLPDPAGIQFLHQTGGKHLTLVRAEADTLPGALTYVALAYIEDVADSYACADLVVCRAGAGTLAEVTASGLPVIAVPYPHAVAGEQEANARVLEEAGAAVIVPDAELTGRRLADAITSLRGAQRRQAMAEASRALGRPHAATHVAELVWRAAGEEARHAVRVRE